MAYAPSISLDFETFNTIDLRAVGAELYSSSPDLIITTMAWAIETGPVQSAKLPASLPGPVLSHFSQGGRLRAWNAAFEWSILANHYGLRLPWDRVDCTMQRALYAGLPAALEKAGPALGIPASQLKDATARRLMLQMAKPRKGGGYWHDDPVKLEDLTEYCRQDVVAERAIARMLPYLPENERLVSALDHEANQRGIALDVDLIRKLTNLARDETSRLNQICGVLTGGEVTSPATQGARLKAWLEAQGLAVPGGLDKAAVATLLAQPLGPATRQVLELRQEVAKTSTRKLVAMTRCAGSDSRVRGQLMYYGASRTGRFSGKLIQPQNMPRPSLAKPILADAIHSIKAGGDADWIDLLYGKPLDVVAQSLRSCLIAGPGKIFVVYDFRQIEARVLAWLAGQQNVLDACAAGEDIYVVAQKQVGLPSRLAAKVVVLACGFGMGPNRFQETAEKYGLVLTINEATQMVADWREANPNTVDLWHKTEKAARRALFKPGPPQKVAGGKVGFTGNEADRRDPAKLTMKLPSGRELFYRNARIEDDPARPGKGGNLTYDGVDQITRKWGPIRTWGGKQVENAVQAIARDCLVDAALRVDAAGWGELVLSVHDELIWEVPIADAGMAAILIKAEVEKSPAFAPDLPVAAEGGIKSSYGV